MPYILQSQRERAAKEPENAGELNFALANLIKGYLRYTGTRYQSLNDVLGALEGAKLEFYRRVVVPYENGKIEENGDVW